MQKLQFSSLSFSPDEFAPDGSEVRLLMKSDEASMVHCSLPAGAVSKALMHKTISEFWYFLSGEGEFWRSDNGEEQIHHVNAGDAINLPQGVKFQFKCTGDEPLEFICSTTPPWPGDSEEIEVKPFWPRDPK